MTYPVYTRIERYPSAHAKRMKLNDFPEISDDFYYVLEKSKYYYDISNSQFDITVNSLSAIWGFNNKVFTKPLKKTLICSLDK